MGPKVVTGFAYINEGSEDEVLNPQTLLILKFLT